jgi:replicative DNA helicase
MSDGLFLASIGEYAQRQLRDGRSFVLEAPTTVPAIWGDDAEVLWAQGESLIVTGPQGVGKSTLVQQLALARASVLDPTLLGFPVRPDERHVLYIAADRPQQIARSMRRMVRDDHADLLAERLKIWAGPLPFDLVISREALAIMASDLNVGTIVIDSLKDVASPLSSDDVGSGVNRAVGTAIAAGVEVVVIHHNRKANSENKKPSALADVYGSVWLTSGAGSVLSLWGDAGDPIIEVTHLKQPADDVGPFEIEHDHDLGTSRMLERQDVWTILQKSTGGITAPDVAEAIYRKPTRPQIEKVRRKLQRLCKKGLAKHHKGSLPTDPVVFRPLPSEGRVEPRVADRVGTRDLHARTRTPENTDHGSYTPPELHEPLKERGVRVGQDGEEISAFSEATDEQEELADRLRREQEVAAGGA